jgi:hypothetical protein
MNRRQEQRSPLAWALAFTLLPLILPIVAFRAARRRVLYGKIVRELKGSDGLAD